MLLRWSNIGTKYSNIKINNIESMATHHTFNVSTAQKQMLPCTRRLV
jgi:hypothetical protein